MTQGPEKRFCCVRPSCKTLHAARLLCAPSLVLQPVSLGRGLLPIHRSPWHARAQESRYMHPFPPCNVPLFASSFSLYIPPPVFTLSKMPAPGPPPHTFLPPAPFSAMLPCHTNKCAHGPLQTRQILLLPLSRRRQKLSFSLRTVPTLLCPLRPPTLFLVHPFCHTLPR